MPTRAGPRAAVKVSSRAGSAFFTLFGLPFLAGGLWAGVMALRALGRPAFDGQTFSLQAIFAITFCGVGAGLVWWGRYSARKAREIAHLKAAHPESPWMWKPEWAGGRIVGSTKATMVFTWGFAIFWNLVSAPLLFVVPREVLEKQNYLGLIGLLFPVVGVGLLYWAARATARWKKFGSSVFEMAAVPGLVGGRLGGTIQTNFVGGAPRGIQPQADLAPPAARTGQKQFHDREDSLARRTDHPPGAPSHGLSRDFHSGRVSDSLRMRRDQRDQLLRPGHLAARSRRRGRGHRLQNAVRDARV